MGSAAAGRQPSGGLINGMGMRGASQSTATASGLGAQGFEIFVVRPAPAEESERTNPNLNTCCRLSDGTIPGGRRGDVAASGYLTSGAVRQ